MAGREALQGHLAKGAAAVIHAAVTGETRKVPLDQLEQMVGTLADAEAMTPEQGAGVLFVDARVITAAGKKDSAQVW